MLSGKSLLVGLVVLVVTISSIHEGYALKCYVCDSATNKNCTTDAKQKAFEKNCTDFDPWVKFINPLDPKADVKNHTDAECVTIKDLKKDGKGTTSVLRTCMPVGTTETFLKANFKLHKTEIGSIKFCKTDLCNSSSSIYAGISSLLVSVMLVLLMK